LLSFGIGSRQFLSDLTFYGKSIFVLFDKTGKTPVGQWSPLKFQCIAIPPTTERESNADNAKEITTF
jgi:hypothetical protein